MTATFRCFYQWQKCYQLISQRKHHRLTSLYCDQSGNHTFPYAVHTPSHQSILMSGKSYTVIPTTKALPTSFQKPRSYRSQSRSHTSTEKPRQTFQIDKSAYTWIKDVADVSALCTLTRKRTDEGTLKYTDGKLEHIRVIELPSPVVLIWPVFRCTRPQTTICKVIWARRSYPVFTGFTVHNRPERSSYTPWTANRLTIVRASAQLRLIIHLY